MGAVGRRAVPLRATSQETQNAHGNSLKTGRAPYPPNKKSPANIAGPPTHS